MSGAESTIAKPIFTREVSEKVPGSGGESRHDHMVEEGYSQAFPNTSEKEAEQIPGFPNSDSVLGNSTKKQDGSITGEAYQKRDYSAERQEGEFKERKQDKLDKGGKLDVDGQKKPALDDGPGNQLEPGSKNLENDQKGKASTIENGMKRRGENTHESRSENHDADGEGAGRGPIRNNDDSNQEDTGKGGNVENHAIEGGGGKKGTEEAPGALEQDHDLPLDQLAPKEDDYIEEPLDTPLFDPREKDTDRERQLEEMMQDFEIKREV